MYWSILQRSWDGPLLLEIPRYLDREVVVCTRASRVDPGMVLGYQESLDTWTERWLRVLQHPRMILRWSMVTRNPYSYLDRGVAVCTVASQDDPGMVHGY